MSGRSENSIEARRGFIGFNARYLICWLLLPLMLAAQWYAASLFDSLAPRIEFNAIDYGMDSAQSVTVSDLEKLTGYEVSFLKNFPAEAEGIAVNAIATNAAYDRYREFDLPWGSFFTETASDIGLNLAVISEDLSFELFQTVRSVGREMKINGLPYKVCGVYRMNPLVSFLSSNGYENIYLPAGSGAERLYGADAAVQSILMTPVSGVPANFTERDTEDALYRVSDNAPNYLQKNFTESGRVVGQFIQIELFLSVIALYIFATRYLWADVKKLPVRDYTAVLVFVLKWVTVLFAALLLYRITAFDLYVNVKYISPERLLDFDFYCAFINSAVQRHNLYYAYSPPVMERLYSAALIWNAVLCALYLWVLKRCGNKEACVFV